MDRIETYCSTFLELVLTDGRTKRAKELKDKLQHLLSKATDTEIVKMSRILKGYYCPDDIRKMRKRRDDLRREFAH